MCGGDDQFQSMHILGSFTCKHMYSMGQYKGQVLNSRYCCSSIQCALQFAFSLVHGTHLLPFGSPARMTITMYMHVYVFNCAWEICLTKR